MPAIQNYALITRRWESAVAHALLNGLAQVPMSRAAFLDIAELMAAPELATLHAYSHALDTELLVLLNPAAVTADMILQGFCDDLLRVFEINPEEMLLLRDTQHMQGDVVSMEPAVFDSHNNRIDTTAGRTVN